MKQPALNEQIVRRYLLGELPARERERLEAGLLIDEGYHETLIALENEVEDELIDEYLDGELTETQRENFERVFQNTPERAHKLTVIKDLKFRAAKASHGKTSAANIVKKGPWYKDWMTAIAFFQNPVLGFSSAVALVLALVCCVWLWTKTNTLETQLQQAKAEHPIDAGIKNQVEDLKKRNQELTVQLDRSEKARAELAASKNGETQNITSPDTKPSPERATFATLILTSVSRSTNQKIPMLTLRRSDTEARLFLNVERLNPTDYKRFRATVKKGDSEVWRDENVKLQPRGNNARAILNISTDKLSEQGQYVGTLDGINDGDEGDPLARYVFRVVHK
jgi:hypothetical protein